MAGLFDAMYDPGYSPEDLEELTMRAKQARADQFEMPGGQHLAGGLYVGGATPLGAIATLLGKTRTAMADRELMKARRKAAAAEEASRQSVLRKTMEYIQQRPTGMKSQEQFAGVGALQPEFLPQKQVPQTPAEAYAARQEWYGKAPPNLMETMLKKSLEDKAPTPEIKGKYILNPDGSYEALPMDEDAKTFKQEELRLREQALTSAHEARMMQIADARARAAETAAYRREMMDLRRSQVETKAAAAAPKSAVPKLTSQQINDRDKRKANITGIDAALKAFEKAPEKDFSYAHGLLIEKVPGGGSLAGRTRSKEANDAIQTANRIMADIRHGLYGAALSAREDSIASQFLPAPYDTKKQVQDKLTNLKLFLERESQALEGHQGVGVAPAEASPSDLEARIEARLKGMK